MRIVLTYFSIPEILTLGHSDQIMFQPHFIFSSSTCRKLPMIQVRFIYHPSHQAKPKINLVFHILLVVVCIDQVPVDLGDCNKKLEDTVIPPLGIVTLLQQYGLHAATIVIVYAIYDKV